MHPLGTVQVIAAHKRHRAGLTTCQFSLPFYRYIINGPRSTPFLTKRASTSVPTVMIEFGRDISRVADDNWTGSPQTATTNSTLEQAVQQISDGDDLADENGDENDGNNGVPLQSHAKRRKTVHKASSSTSSTPASAPTPWSSNQIIALSDDDDDGGVDKGKDDEDDDDFM